MHLLRSCLGHRLVGSIAAALIVVSATGTSPSTADSPAPAPVLRLAGRAWGPADARTSHLATIGAGSSTNAGAGVGIALIDSGVSRNLAATRRVIVGPDFTGDGDGVDRFGHGTFLAGLLVGDRDGAIRGVAPASHVVSVKITGADGAVELDRVLAAIDWVIQHRDEFGIRVLALAMGVDPTGPYTDSTLAMALEAAWASGIVVVVPTGNLGPDRVTAPGDDPWLLSVGATDDRSTPEIDDDVVASWSGRGAPAGYERPDLFAPGTALVSLRAPSSTLDRQFGGARQEGNLFRGSGTSLATALVAGLAADVIAEDPSAGPDDVKHALVSTARQIADGAVPYLPAAIAATSPGEATQSFPTALLGWDGSSGTWTGTSWTGTSWTGTSWTGTSWTGTSWTGTSWTGTSWTGTSWTGTWTGS